MACMIDCHCHDVEDDCETPSDLRASLLPEDDADSTEVAVPLPLFASIPPKSSAMPRTLVADALPEPLVAAAVVGESPTKAIMDRCRISMNEFHGLPSPDARARMEKAVQDMREKLKGGVTLSVGEADTVRVSYDQELQCLDVREWATLYPLANLGEASHSEPGGGGGAYALNLCFEDYGDTAFRFEKASERAAFVATIQLLALEARKEKWHEDWDDTTASVLDSLSDDELTPRQLVL